MQIERKISMKSMAGFSAFDENFGLRLKREDEINHIVSLLFFSYPL